MAKIDLYKVSQKDGHTLVSDIDPIFFTSRLVRSEKVFKRRESLDVILNVDQLDESLLDAASSSDSLQVIRTEAGKYSIRRAQRINERIHQTIRCAFLDRVFQNEAILNQYLLYRDMFFYYGRYHYGGFYGVIHKLFPLVFIMRTIRGYQPMVWQMIILDRHFTNKVRDNLISHYKGIEEGMKQAFHNLTITQVENTALAAVNNIIREDEDGEGFNKAAKLCDRFGLGFLKGFLWSATQATEDTEWDVYKRPPIPFVRWPRELEENR